MTKYRSNAKLNKIAQITIVLSSLACFTSVAEARDGCPVGKHPNPHNRSQCVDNGTTGLGTHCNPGQKKWYDPLTKQWNRC